MKAGFSLGCAALVSVAALSVSDLASAAESVLFSFPTGSRVVGQVQEDSSGNLYGTTSDENQYGTVYRLQQRQGVWRAKNIHVFEGRSDGANPYAGLTLNRTAGAYYGVAEYGGANGAGVIFALSQAGRRWTESTLHTFTGTDGENPIASLTNDRATGTLYGTAYEGGNAGCGTAFQLNPASGQFSVLHTFQGGSDGCNPFTQLREGVKSGTLIGALSAGTGALFLLTEKGGTWKNSILHNFTGGADGGSPSDLTILTSDGTNSIYGVALSGGLYHCGVVFRLSRPVRKWQYDVIYNFSGGDGRTPVGIHLDNVTGTLYGTTETGGAFGSGTLFKLVSSGGKWTKTVLHNFGSAPDGAFPLSRPIVDQQTGLLYGTTYQGGTQNSGTVYSATP